MGNARIFAALLFLACRTAAGANDGLLDISFGFLGEVELQPAGMSADTFDEFQLRIDGQHRLVGCIRTLGAGNVEAPWLFRLTASGATDSSFATTGSKFVSLPAGATGLGCEGFAVGSDGGIVLASYDGSNQYIMRFKEDGTTDTAFNGTGTLKIARTGSSNDFITDIAIAADGSVYIAYERATANGARFLVRHVLSGGTVDGAFGPGATGLTLFDGFATRTGVIARDDYPNHILLAPDGAIVLTGYTKPTATGNIDFAAARLSASGIPDSGFGSAGAAIVAFDLGQGNGDLCSASTFDKHGRLVMVGSAERATVGDDDFAVVRLLSNGAPDPSFSGDGKTVVAFDLNGSGSDIGDSVVVQSDGRILVGGFAKHVTGNSSNDWAVARLLDGGGLDTSFGQAGNGKQTYSVNLGGNNDDFLYEIAANGSDFGLAGVSKTGATTEAAILARMRIDLIFADPFGG